MKVVHKQEAFPQAPCRRRVAAYARVSNGDDDTQHSLSAQISYYNDLIQKRIDWEFAGVYADYAMTGTKDNRPEFQRLLADCRAGKIDGVITKSVTRFARNTVITLKTVRELKELGIDVYFEKENIHSTSGDGELMLTILASFAQEESRSTSENIKWRFRNGFKNGKPLRPVTALGYKLVNDKPVVVSEEACIVRMAFADYLSGMGYQSIAKKLTQIGVIGKNGGELTGAFIRYMLTNPIYVGDIVMQKTFVADHIEKKARRNKGELPMYCIDNHHEAIIDRETFAKVRTEMAKRTTISENRTRYPFTGKIVCGQCGKHYVRHTIHKEKKENGWSYWICSATYTGKAHCPLSQNIPESTLLDIADMGFEKIIVSAPNTLTLVMPDGAQIEKHWRREYRKTAQKRQPESEKSRKEKNDANE